jgi:hypothetical protein
MPPVVTDPGESVVRAFHNGRVLEAVEQVRSAAVGCADTPVWSLSDADLAACLDVVHQAEQALAAVKLHLVRQAEVRDLPRVQHAYSCAGRLRTRLRLTSPVARRAVDAAKAVDERPSLDQALIAGAVNVEQAVVIDECLTGMPAEVGGEAVEKAEALLIGWAGEFDAKGLRMLGARILEHVAPEVAERVEAAALSRQEARAYATRTLSIVGNGDGRVRLTGWLDTEAAAIVTAALDPLCSPRTAADTLRHPTGSAVDGGGLAGGAVTGQDTPPFRVPGSGDTRPETGADRVTGDERTAGQRRADALLEVCRLVLTTGHLPVNGGDRPQLTVTVAYDPLRRELGVGTLDTGHRLTATATRRLACDAQILPAVLGSQGQVLDVGQSRRLITGALRRALVARDRGCAFPGCDRPPRWCDGHHISSWANGGPTSLDNAVLLCGYHHRVVHHSDWTVRLAHDGHPEFVPPAHLDPARLPRRNLYHRRT